jgi:hypothetical protein
MNAVLLICNLIVERAFVAVRASLAAPHYCFPLSDLPRASQQLNHDYSRKMSSLSIYNIPFVDHQNNLRRIHTVFIMQRST